MADKLLPCPFCGCTKIPVQRGNGIGDVWLECTECEASTRLRENIQTCVKDWNRRAASPADQVPAGYRLQPISEFDAYQDVLRDAERYRSAIALEDNAETLYAAVLNHGGGNSFAINAEFDTALSATPPAAETR